MPGFGRFESVEELASSGPVTVYSAKAPGESGPPRLAVKAFETQDDFADPEIIERRAGAFLAGAALQKELAAKAPASWAPVHDSRRDEGHAYYVTDLYPVTGQRIVDSRRDLSAQGVARIIGGVSDALAALHAHTPGRGHGGIRPGNVLIRPKDLESGELGDALVVLADPVPQERLSEKSLAEDSRELADLLHQIVVHRPAPKAGAVERGPEWAALGGPGEALRALCEQLLNPQSGGVLLSPADVRARLAEALRVRTPSKGPNKAMVAGVVTLVLLAGGVGAYFALQGGSPRFREDSDSRLRYVDAPAQWLVQEEGAASGLLAKIDTSLARGSGTQDDDAAREKLAGELAKIREELTILRGEAFPGIAGPQLLDQQKGFNARVAGVETELKRVNAGLDQLRGRLPEVKEGEDPRVPSVAQWMSGPEKRLRDAYAAAQSDLKEAGPEGAGDLARLDAEFQRVTGEIEAIRRMAWDDAAATEGEGVDPGQASQMARAKLERQKEIVARVEGIGAEVRKVNAEAAASLDRSRELLKAWLNAQRDAGASVAQSDVLVEEFKQSLRSMVGRVDQKKLGWSEARARVAALEAWAKGVDQALPAMPEVPKPAKTSVDFDDVVNRYANARNDHLKELAEPLVQDNVIPDLSEASYRARVDAARADLVILGQRSRDVLVGATEIEALLADGYTLNEPGAGGASGGGRSIDQARGVVATISRDNPLENAVAEVMARVAELERVEGLSEPGALTEAILSAGEEPSRVWAAWTRLLGAGYPSRAAQLTEMVRLRQEAVAPALEKVVDLQRRAAMLNRASADVKAAWITFVNDRAGETPAEVVAAFESMGAAGVAAPDLTSLNNSARMNLERWRFMQEVGAKVSAADKEGQIAQIIPVATTFLTKMDAAYPTTPAKLAGFRKQLGDFAKGKVVDLREEGPGRAGWAGVPEADGSAVTYTWKTHTLRFVKVQEDSENASFLCTTEASLRLFVDLVGAAGTWADLTRMGQKQGKLNDNRDGPIVWRWWQSAGNRMEPNPPEAGVPKSPNGNGWFTPLDPISQRGYYPPEMREPAPPSWNSPMTYVSAQGALYATALMGCRLPTPVEWKRARDMEGDVASSDANRRDAVWVQQHAYITQLYQPDENGNRAFNGARFPNGQILRVQLEGEQPTGNEADAQAAVDRNDGWLWFRPVHDGGGGVFRHLEGNVAEWVYTDTRAMEGAYGKKFTELSTFFGRTGEGLGVIGASALSPAEYSPEALLESGVAPGKKGFRMTPIGFSDVGFRPAFTTGAGGGAGLPRERLLGVLANTPYLTSGDR